MNTSDSLLRRCRRMIRLASDTFMDWRLNVDTLSGAWTAIPRPGERRYEEWQAAQAHRYLPTEASRYGDSKPNIPASWLALRTFVAGSDLHADDIFYDIGCGSGRVLCHVAVQGVSKCVGVELSAEFSAKARANAKSLRRRACPIEVRVGDAAEMDYTDGTVFFLANPFGSETLRTVVDRIGATLPSNPRPARFIYVNPVHRDVLESTGWLKHVGERRLSYSDQRAEYWATDPRLSERSNPYSIECHRSSMAPV
jgi:SAM-dependent methyltransferase